MKSPARKRLQIPFKDLEIGQRFQMVNAVMAAAIPGSIILTKKNEFEAEFDSAFFTIRPDWHVEAL